MNQSFKKFCLQKCGGNIGEAVEHEDKLCDKVETVRELRYLGERMNTGGRSEDVVTARARYGWFKLRD